MTTTRPRIRDLSPGPVRPARAGGRRDAAVAFSGAKLAIPSNVAVNGLAADGGPNPCGTTLSALLVRSRRAFAFQILRG